MKKKSMKVLSVCSLASLVISGSVISTTGVKAEETTSRLGGSDRYETAVKISQAGWKSGSDYVVLANGQGFADALCANPIARSKDAPILLTESNSLNSSTLAELKRLNAKHVIVVGGTGVVPTAIENTIKTQLNADVTRYGGADRYETSVKIAKALGNTSKIVLASGKDFADALSVGPAASIEGIPVILTQPDQLPTVTSDYIKSNTNLTKTYVIGETASVSASLYSTLKNPERFGGIDRFETNAKVIDGFKSDFNFSNAYVALGKGPIGNEFADSLTGGALAAKNKSALVITSSPISSYTTALLKDKFNTGSTLTILGGIGNITDSMVSTLKGAITNPPDPDPTPGPGGDGEIEDITSFVTADPNFANRAENFNSIFGNYLTVGEDSKETINVKLLKTNPVRDAFETSQGKTDTEIEDKLKDAQTQIDKIYSGDKLNTFKIGEDTLGQFLSALDSKYIDKDGKLQTNKIITEIRERSDSNEAYTDFRNELKSRVKDYFNAHPEKADLDIYLRGYKIESISKDDGTVSYNFGTNYDNSTRANSIVDLLLPDENSNINGGYTVKVNSGGTIFSVKINVTINN
ncbi:cell wall-binding repeat-containing protein [Clostridium tyrobutyricum]|uniref:cell wall-binding repeat-containing protein n=1 Tax=Clostridium tyrobutyricum TaxID=1519 RepID=UPI00073D54D6|nr:cell wall-binding repeat-containing protein [Clostridium tyrobutyricum]